MVQRIKDFIIGTVVMLGIFVIPSGIVGNIENHYKLNAVVTDINGYIVTVVDYNGNEWDFNGTEYEIGQNVQLTMFTRFTDRITDDEIVKVKIKG